MTTNVHLEEYDILSCPVIVSVAVCMRCPPNSSRLVLLLDTSLEEKSCASLVVFLSKTPCGWHWCVGFHSECYLRIPLTSTLLDVNAAAVRA
jgi:hypothetical protein